MHNSALTLFLFQFKFISISILTKVKRKDFEANKKNQHHMMIGLKSVSYLVHRI
jgi:hypothetical protein